jgi:hypothetical protein
LATISSRLPNWDNSKSFLPHHHATSSSILFVNKSHEISLDAICYKLGSRRIMDDPNTPAAYTRRSPAMPRQQPDTQKDLQTARRMEQLSKLVRPLPSSLPPSLPLSSTLPNKPSGSLCSPDIVQGNGPRLRWLPHLSRIPIRDHGHWLGRPNVHRLLWHHAAARPKGHATRRRGLSAAGAVFHG